MHSVELRARRSGRKTSLIDDPQNLLDLTLNPVVVAASPSDAQNLHRAPTADITPRADAARLADELSTLAQADSSQRTKAAQSLMPDLVKVLDQIRSLL